MQLTPFNNLLQCIDATTALNLFYSMFKPIVDKHAPTRRKRVKQQILPGWLTGEITEAMKIRDKLKKDKQFLNYKKQRNKVTTLIRDAKRAYFSKLINQNSDTATIWKAMNNITNKSTGNIKPPKINTSVDAFNDRFLSVASFLKNPNVTPARPFKNSQTLTTFCRNKLRSHDSCIIPEMTVYEVGKYISNLKNKKSTGPDAINVFLLKTALPYIIEPLTYIYNLCIRQSVFPDIFKKAKVIPLPKSKAPSSPNDFRPISLLCVLSKPLEKHIYQHLIDFIEHHELFHPFQSGFRKYHSCHTALVRLCDKWLTSINKSEITGVIFLDFKKAFDLVNHDILLKKLSIYFQNRNTLDLLSSFLHDRTQYVHFGGSSSKEGTITCGVPQGSILGPLLFCLFINDLPIHIQGDSTLCELFADDSSIHTHSSNLNSVQLSLQHACDDVLEWCEKNEMVLHPEKTQCMVVTSRQKHQLQPLKLDIKLHSNSLRQVHAHKVLGVYIDQELKWQTHIEHVSKIVSRNLFLLNKLKHYVNADARKLFFLAHCLSHINYGSTIWCNASDVHIKKLNSLHRRGIKLVSSTQIPTNELFQELNLLTLQQQFTYNVALFMFKVLLGCAPPYLSGLITRSSTNHTSVKLLLPLPRIDMYKTSFSFYGAKVWNSLPPQITNSKTVQSFKHKLRSHLLEQ